MDPAFSGAFRLEWKNIDKRVKEKVNMKKKGKTGNKPSLALSDTIGV